MGGGSAVTTELRDMIINLAVRILFSSIIPDPDPASKNHPESVTIHSVTSIYRKYSIRPHQDVCWNHDPFVCCCTHPMHHGHHLRVCYQG
jgi:hypothetical protein